MNAATYARELNTGIDFDSLLPAMIRTPKGEVEAVTWGEGPTVVALHGAMGGWDQGVLLARTVAFPHFKFIAISRPGYLGTPLSAGRSPQEQTDLCAAVLDALRMNCTAMMAISGGGPTALQFALRYPDRCKALVMISACSQRLDVPVPLRWNFMKLMARIPGFTERMRKRVQQAPAKAIERAVPQPALRNSLMRDRESTDLLLRL
jgi:pimeloyl-ACP methyl ester carboxylesterase